MISETKIGLRDRIRECAQIAGSGDELSRKTGIPRRTLENYLSGKSSPKAETLASIAEAAGVGIEWLATGHGAKVRGVDRAAIYNKTGIDPVVFGQVLSAVDGVYVEEKVPVSKAELGEAAARVYEKVFEIDDEAEFRGGLRVALADLRRSIRAKRSSQSESS